MKNKLVRLLCRLGFKCLAMKVSPEVAQQYYRDRHEALISTLVQILKDANASVGDYKIMGDSSE